MPREIELTVSERNLADPNDDAAYWRSRSPEERITALEEIRDEYHRWKGDAESRLQTVLQSLNNNSVRYLMIGVYAVAFHGHPRYTKGIDVWIERTPENASVW